VSSKGCLLANRLYSLPLANHKKIRFFFNSVWLEANEEWRNFINFDCLFQLLGRKGNEGEHNCSSSKFYFSNIEGI